MKKIIKIIIITILFILIFVLLNKLLSPKYMDSLIEGSMIAEYYEEEKNHDVIFIGDCEVYANFSPMVMYEETGITSYVRGTPQQLIWQSYGILKETLKYEIPKVVVFNVNSLRYSEPVKEEYNRLTLDKMKWSKEKVETIKASMTEDETFISYVFPILRYHSRFSELSAEDFKYLFTDKKHTFNGFLINKIVKPAGSLPTKKVLPDYNFAKNCYEYLDKITELCKNNNIKLVLIKAPSLYPYWYEQYNDQMVEYSEKNNIDFYNLKEVAEKIEIDYSTDTYDAGLHLNLNGATKLSKYFSRLLKENYDLKDYRKDSKINAIYQEKLRQYNIAIKD